MPGYSIHLDGREKAFYRFYRILLLTCRNTFHLPYVLLRPHKGSKKKNKKQIVHFCSDKVFKIDYFDTEILSSLFLSLRFSQTVPHFHL